MAKKSKDKNPKAAGKLPADADTTLDAQAAEDGEELEAGEAQEGAELNAGLDSVDDQSPAARLDATAEGEASPTATDASVERQAGLDGADDLSAVAAEAPRSGGSTDGHAPLLSLVEEGDDESDDGALEEASDVDPDDALREFEDYEGLDEELAGDRQLEEQQAESAEGDARLTPKDRRLATMRLEAKVEAVIFASQKPLKPQEILDTLGDPTIALEHVETTLAQLVEFYADRNGGFRLHYLKRLGYQFQTADAAGPIMERMFASRPRPISRAALETLAIIAYRQPVTRAEVEFIRGVDAGSIFKTLLERDLIKCTGRKEIVGRPMLFGTTDNFLTVFNLSSIKDLPPLESFQPSREMVQGAMEKLEGQDDLVDVEEYIADNTRGEYEGGDSELVGDDGTEDDTQKIDGATAADVAPAAEMAPEQSEDVPHGSTATNADSEVSQPDGDSLPSGSGDLDQ